MNCGVDGCVCNGRGKMVIEVDGMLITNIICENHLEKIKNGDSFSMSIDLVLAV